MGVISSIINILFEVWFIWYLVCKAKEIDNKKVITYILTTISYIIASIVINFTYKNQIYMLLVLALLIYIFMKIMFKKKFQISDLFIIYYIAATILLAAIITQLVFGYTFIALIIDRIILLSIALMFGKHIRKLYKKYINNWNRGKENKIKSITLRNMSILFMNITIFAINSYILYYFLSLLNK